MKELRPESKLALEALRTAWKNQFGDDIPDESSASIKEVLWNYPVLFTDLPCDKRHWVETPTVFKVGDVCIRASMADTTDDISPEEKGWEFDLNSMAIVYPVRVMVTKYRTLEEINKK